MNSFERSAAEGLFNKEELLLSEAGTLAPLMEKSAKARKRGSAFMAISRLASRMEEQG